MDSITVTGLDRTLLARTLNVAGCDAAVTRFVLPKKYYNFKASTIKINFSGETTQKTFPAGHYPDVVSIVEMLEHVITSDEELVLFDADTERMTVKIVVKNPRNSIVFTDDLADKLNLPTKLRGTNISSAPVKLMKQYFFLQSDFVQPQLVNGTSMQLLYVAHEHNSNEYVKIPSFVPVCKDYLDSVKLWLTDEHNEPVKFLDGKSLVQLQFRKT